MTGPGFTHDDAPLDDVLQSAVEALRAPVDAHPAALASVKLAIRREPAAAPMIAARTSTAPASRQRWFSPVPTSPLTMLAAATLLVVSTSLITRQLSAPALTPSLTPTASTPEREIAASNPAQMQAIRFTLSAPGARRVSLVGDFNAWNPTASTLQRRNGTWTIVIPVASGRHQYAFVVDGSMWIPDPSAAQSAESDFGRLNSVLFVGG